MSLTRIPSGVSAHPRPSGVRTPALPVRTILPIALALFNASAHAQDLFWVCGDGYRWDSSPATFCWSTTPLPPATVVQPATGDNVFLTQSGATDITVEYYDPAATSLGNLLIEGTGAGLMTLSQVTYPHDLLASFVTVGDTGSGRVILANGTHTVSSDLILGNGTTGSGTFTVSNGAALTADWLYTGNDGTGTLAIQGGGTVSDSIGYVGYGTGSNGTVSVDGTGSRWDNSSALRIADAGTATLDITGGGTVTSLTGSLAIGSTGNGTVTIDGTGSTWTNSFNINIGFGGTGTLNIENGGSVSNQNAFLGYLAGSNGTATVDGAGSTWTSLASLYVGGSATAAGGSGTLTVRNGGAVDVAGTLKVWNGGSVSLDGGSITTSNFDAAAGTLNFTNGTLTVDGGTYTDGSTNLIVDSTGPGDNPTLRLVNGGSANVLYDAIIGDFGTGTLAAQNGGTLGTAGGVLGFRNGSSGTANINGPGSTWISSGNLTVGYSGAGTLNIQNGGAVTATGSVGYVGRSAGSSGSIMVDGAGSTWTSGNLHIGDAGVGTLIVQNGGSVNSTSLGSVGLDASAAGMVTVQGAGSSWDSLSHYIGYNGNGTLEILNGGSVTGLVGSLGYTAGSSGTATVDGAGSIWTSTNGLFVGGYSAVAGGSGALTVQNDGTIEAGALLKVWNTGSLSLYDGSITTGSFDADPGTFNFVDGTLTVDGGIYSDGNTHLVVDSTAVGANPTLVLANVANAAPTGSIIIGDSGNGTFHILSGADVTSSGGTLGNSPGSSGSVTVDGTGSTWTSSGNLTIGDDGSGSLNILNGGSVSNTFGYVGLNAGGSGTVTVDGASSTWSNSSGIIVGLFGPGDLTIRNGGSVSNDIGTLAADPGSSAAVTVEGTGSTWSNSSILAVGEDGPALVTIRAGGTVTSTTGYLGRFTGTGTVTLDGAGSSWLNSGDLYVGEYATGILNIQNGGAVSNALATLGYMAGGDGTAIVTGTGSQWSSSDRLIVGDAGNGTLDILNGGSVDNTDGWLGLNASGSGTATVDGPGSSWTNTDSMIIGFVGTGALNILNGGQVSATSNSSLGGSGPGGTGDGTAIVDGAGSTWTSGNGLYIGAIGTGTLTIQNGGHVTDTDGFVGDSGYGTATVDGTGSAWDNSNNLTVGNYDTGILTIQNGGSANSTNSYIGMSSGSVGTVSVDGALSNWNNGYQLTVGSSGNGSFLVSNGGTVDSTRAYLGEDSGSSGTVVVTGSGSSWTNTDAMYIGGSQNGVGGSGNLQVLAGGTVDVTNLLKVWSTGNVELAGGILNTGDIDVDGTFTFNSGHLGIGTDFGIGPAGPLGSDLTLTAVHSLSVGGTTTIDPFSMLTLDGGSFATGALLGNGVFDFRRGTFSLTNADLNIGSSGLFGGAVPLDYGKTVYVTHNVSVDPGAVLTLRGGSLTAGQVTNNGLIELSDVLSDLAGGGLLNNGVLRGDGRISAPLTNSSTGEVRADAGRTLVFQGTGNSSAGRFTLLGGTLDFSQGMNNTGQISGHGTLIAGPTATLTNTGAMAFTGNTDLIGDVNNAGGGSIIISGGATATFHDDVTHNGSEIRVSSGSQAVFFGAVAGSGPYTGTGTVSFEGDLNPGNSPGLFSVEGDMALGINSHTIMEIAGLARGTEYDAFDIGGNLALGGHLDLGLPDFGSGLFDPQAGDSFDLFMATTISGDFDILTLATLGDGLGWQLDILNDAIGFTDIVRLSVVTTTVPVPPTVWLLVSGLLGLIVAGRPRRSA